MKTCSGCRRIVPVTWAVDGTSDALCSRCIVRALKDAEAIWLAERMRRLFGR